MTSHHVLDLETPQVDLHLLRSRLGICKSIIIVSAVKPGTSNSQLSRFDEGYLLVKEVLCIVEVASTSQVFFVGRCNSCRNNRINVIDTTFTITGHILDKQALSTLCCRSYQGVFLPILKLVMLH